MTPRGVEQGLKVPEKRENCQTGGTESGTVGGSTDTALASVIQAWPSLTPLVKSMILALVRQADHGG